jgi:5-methylcytosine-specific restriction endonuclease McrA
MRTLLLNKGYEPIEIIPWQDAITLWWVTKAEILSSYEDKVIRSCYLEMPTPAVLRLKTSHRYRRDFVPFERHFVYARDQWTCQYCGNRFPEDDLSYDHVIPECRGGKTWWDNIATACSSCNSIKDDRTPEEAGMPLLRRPKKPSWLPGVLALLVHKGEVPPQWADWVDWLLPVRRAA